MRVAPVVLIFVAILPLGVTVSAVCKNGGEPLQGKYQKCSCAYGFKGYDCSKKVGPCEGNPCKNSAKCIENDNGTFSCKCLDGFRGILCEEKIRSCDSEPCKNGGNCTDDGVKCFKCECQPGFKGSDCSKKIKPCEISPCKNGGICSNEDDGGFNGYTGPICGERDDLDPFKAPVYRNSQNAINTNSNYGPSFGGGHVFCIKNNSNSSSGSYTNFGYTYKPPSGYEYNTAGAKNLLAGSYNFLSAEIEVFHSA